MLSAQDRQRSAEVAVVREQIESLQRQLNVFDSGLNAITQSRTWRSLTGIGRIFGGGSGG
jgi:hypothetical protein